jgi:hypothetical protein
MQLTFINRVVRKLQFPNNSNNDGAWNPVNGEVSTTLPETRPSVQRGMLFLFGNLWKTVFVYAAI